ncbi:hypothetical protein [Filomicrobium sp.]|uniref:hypothetical protein n=1 Tax=Filomicrobium sp. TaxID=2024831 RepID=UPI00258D4AD4|nr:hypothetical protein [Filomicrobium sp.]MCV0371788.1 hypothetical protein [Filomicrobium sp.]
MTLDVRGSLKNTKLSKNPLVVFEELFSNAIDAFLIRKSIDANSGPLGVELVVEIEPKDLLGDLEDLSITCKDNGSGFADDQAEAFLTKDTSYKDDLLIPGIGQCKGSGRIQYFHHFSQMMILSGFERDFVRYKRTLAFSEGQKQIDYGQFRSTPDEDVEIGSTITLRGLRDNVRNRIFGNKPLSHIFTAKVLKNHLLVSAMRRLVSLSQELGEFDVQIKVAVLDKNGARSEQTESLRFDDIPDLTTSCCVRVHEIDSSTRLKTPTFHALTLSHYKLTAQDYDLPSNYLALCAKSSPAKSITSRYLRSKTLQNRPLDGNYHVIMVEGRLLDDSVNEQRDDFDIPEKLQDNDLFEQSRISLEQIYEAIDDVINEFVAPPDWSKDEIIKNVSAKFGISEAMLTETDTRIRFGDTPTTVAKRVLGKYQDTAISETAKIFDLKEAILSVDPSSDEFREKINEIAWRHTSTLRSIDMANLSQLVVRRAAIVEVLSLACNRLLRVQESKQRVRRNDEKIIHSIFFPMRKDSTQVTDHDIWLLSEEYQYFQYIASDVPLANIAWEDGGTLFEDDIDSALTALMAKNETENAGKRPDIAIFGKEGAAIIIEFKSPGVSLDDHVADLMEYSQLLAAKSRGRLKQFYGYLIGNTINQNRLRGYKRFPNGKGYFGTEAVVEHNTSNPLGELYSEILFYDEIVKRATDRLSVFKKRLSAANPYEAHL